MKSVLTILFTKYLVSLLAAVIACTFLFYYTRHSGMGISPDSVMYQTTAFNIRYHFSFTDFNGMPLVDFPLGYPSFLALAMLVTGCSVLSAAPVINCLLLSGIIFLTARIIEGYEKKSGFFTLAFLAALATSPCLLELYSMLWSETLFLFLILLFFVSFQHYRTTTDLNRLWIPAGVVALACCTRYAGICLLGTGLFLLLFDGSLSVSKKIKHGVLFAGTGISLMLINLIRNQLVSGNFTGVREKAIHGFAENIQQAGIVLADWFPILEGHEYFATVLFIAIIIMGIGKLIFRIGQQQYFKSPETLVACFFVGYSFFLIGIASISRFEDLSSRLLSPMYIPLLLVAGSWVVPVLTKLTRVKKKVFITLVLFFYGGFQYHHYQLNAEAWEGIRDAGIPGYTEDSWTQSPVIAFIKKNKRHFVPPVYSNAPDAVYFLTGLHAWPLPHKEISSEINLFLQQPSFYLLWFTDGENADLISLSYIKQQKTQVSLQQLDGGAVYYFTGSNSQQK